MEPHVMLLNVVLTGRDPTTHELRSGGRTVGWIRPGRLGLGGFSNRAGAQEASRVAVDVLEAWYAAREQSIGDHAPAEWGESSRDEDLLRGQGFIVGRLVAPGSSIQGEDQSHGFELTVPATTWLAVMLQLAQRIHIAFSERRRATAEADETPPQAEAVTMSGHAV